MKTLLRYVIIRKFTEIPQVTLRSTKSLKLNVLSLIQLWVKWSLGINRRFIQVVYYFEFIVYNMI